MTLADKIKMLVAREEFWLLLKTQMPLHLLMELMLREDSYNKFFEAGWQMRDDYENKKRAG